MSKLSALEDPISYGNPFADSTSRFAIDALLRFHGFKIKYRRHGQEPVWERYGDEFRQRDALRMIPNDEIDKARRSEDRYYDSACVERGNNRG